MGKLLRLTYSVMRLDGSEIRSMADRLPFVPMAGSSEYRGNGKNYIRGEKGRFAGSRPAGGGSGSGGSGQQHLLFQRDMIKLEYGNKKIKKRDKRYKRSKKSIRKYPAQA